MLSNDAECNLETRRQKTSRFIILPFVVAVDLTSTEYFRLYACEQLAAQKVERSVVTHIFPSTSFQDSNRNRLAEEYSVTLIDKVQSVLIGNFRPV
jgi:hypothetical protein